MKSQVSYTQEFTTELKVQRHKDSCAVTARREMLSARESQWTLYRRRHLGGALENEIMLFTYTLCKGGGVRTQGNEETRNIF